jgi:hypothetical protein
MRSILAFVCVAATWLTSAVALACGSVPPSYFTIAAIKPADGTTGFALDGAVRVELVDTWVYDVDGTYQPNTRITVTRIDTDEVVPGTIGGFGVGYNPMWLPDESLAANTQYRIDVVTADEPRTDIDGPIAGSSTFTTGDAPSAPLALDGDLRVVGVRAGKAQECTSWNDCGDCAPDREIPVVYVDVELPKVSGGFDEYGYGAWVSPLEGDGLIHYSRVFSAEGADWRQFPSEVPAHWTGLLSPLGHPYVPCFELRVLDSLKHELTASGCLDHAVDVEALLHPDAGSSEPPSQSGERSDPADFDAGSEDTATVATTDMQLNADAGAAAADEESTVVAAARERTTVDGARTRDQGDCSAMPIAGPHSPGLVAPAAVAWLALRSRRRKRALQA